MARCTWYNIICQFVSDLRQVSGFLQVLQFPPPIKLTAMIIYPLHTFLHSVLVQDFVSGRAYCVNQYHYESLWVVMRLVHATGKTWYKVLYQHTMYVIILSNISIKTNFKQITKIVLKLTYKKCICTIPWVWLHFVHDVTSFVTVHSPMCGCCSIPYSVTVQSSYYALFIWRDVEWKYWKYVLENDNMTVNSQYII